MFDIAVTAVTIVRRDSPGYVSGGEIVGGKLFGVHENLKLLLKPSKTVDFGHAFHFSHLALYDPVLNGPQFHGRAISSDFVLIDFTQSGGDWAHFRLSKPLRNLRASLLNSLKDKLTGEVDVGGVLENDRHLREAVL